MPPSSEAEPVHIQREGATERWRLAPRVARPYWRPLVPPWRPAGQQGTDVGRGPHPGGASFEMQQHPVCLTHQNKEASWHSREVQRDNADDGNHAGGLRGEVGEHAGEIAGDPWQCQQRVTTQRLAGAWGVPAAGGDAAFGGWVGCQKRVATQRLAGA